MACPTCAPRYCAPSRCYCGHLACEAFATYVQHVVPKTEKVEPVYDDTASAVPVPVAEPSDWDEREGPTWIDNL